MPYVTRFAPSPTGPLHLGHAFSAGLGARLAADSGGRWLLRIEDLDRARCRPAFAEAIRADLGWLGLEPEGPPLCQSGRRAAHRAALESLLARGLLYACICTRGALEAAAAPHPGETATYPGTCRGRAPPADGTPFAWRLDLSGLPVIHSWEDLATGPREGRADLGGDPILWRKDDGPSYHLACVLDDAEQGISLVVRGRDLEAWTPLQRLLQALLGLPAPRYLHHRLLLGPDGRRLAKRDQAATLAALRAAGVSGPALCDALAALDPHGPDIAYVPDLARGGPDLGLWRPAPRAFPPGPG
ncbi:tRNA glutamyl-Q(34) synthetase GluQRS [Thermaurantiacus sp.]